jgi:signal transduction histidine kinase
MMPMSLPEGLTGPRSVQLAEIALGLLQAEDPQSAVSLLGERMCALFGCEVFLNFLSAERGGRRQLHLNTSHGLDPKAVDGLEWYEFGKPVCGVAAERQQPMKVCVKTDPPSDLTRAVDAYGMTAYMCVPLQVGGRLIGTMGFGKFSGLLRDEDYGALQFLAQPVALAMERVIERKALQAAKEAAEAASRAKDRFLAVLSHELRTPLTPVMGALALLERRADLPEDAREDLELIRRNVQAEARLIDDLLDLTRIARGKVQLQSSPVDVVSVVGSAVSVFRAVAEEKGVALKVLTEPGLPGVMGDPFRLRQVVVNLLGNAVKFTPRGGEVRVVVSNLRHRVRIEVADTGIGIPPETLPRVFDAFEQAYSEDRLRPDGLGLGLTIARSLVEMHGGTISAASGGVGRGAVFTVELPACEASERPADAVPGSPRRLGAGLRLLLVEDHADTRNVLARAIESMGVHVTTAGTVTDATELLRRQRFDAVLSDIGLPDGSGLDVAPARGGAVAVAISGFGSEEDRRRSLDAGFSEHLIKPVSLPRLEEVLRRLLVPHAAA